MPGMADQVITAMPVIYIIEDESAVRDSLAWTLRHVDAEIKAYALPSEILRVRPVAVPSCLLVDIRLPEMDGLALLAKLRRLGWQMPFVVISGFGDVSLAVDAMRLGAIDFLQKPVDGDEICRLTRSAIQSDCERIAVADRYQAIARRLDQLTKRETDVLKEVVAGRLNKQIAVTLGIKIKTVETHRANLMRKLAVDSVAQLVRSIIEYRQFKATSTESKEFD